MKNKVLHFLIGSVALAFMILGSIEEPLPEPTEEQTEDIIHWKDEEVHIEKIEVGTVTEPQVTFYNVPLSEELQLHIINECEKHNIAPAIIIAMIERESYYNANDIGDNGKSFGLMQIQPKWHQARMDRLGCTDLLDPFQNVTVGIDIVAGHIQKNADIYYVLMAYNGGSAYANRRLESGNISDYAIGIVERASELQNEVE
jgi:hypothetical protein